MDIAFIKCYIKSRFCVFLYFCGLLHSGFVFNKTETWFWYSKIKIQPCQKLYLCTGDHFFHTRSRFLIHFWRKSFDSNLIHLKNTKTDQNLDPLVFDPKCSNVKLVYINSAFWIYMRLSINNLCEIDGIFVISLWYLCEIEKKVKRTYMYIGPKT